MSGLCIACEQARHMFCDGAGRCECDLRVPYELRGAGAQRASDRLTGALVAAVVIAALVIAMAALTAHAQISGQDFCQGPSLAKSSSVINCSGTGECKLVAAVANQQIQVCAIVFDTGGTSPTTQLDYGTKTSTECDTNVTHLSGVMTAAKSLPGPLDYFTAPAGNELCLNLGGTTPTAVGVVTYVQK
jgi:hypothetical protein